MELLLAIIVVALLIALAALAMLMKRSVRKTDYPYRKQDYFMSQAELAFFQVLQRVVPQHYYIFSQVSLNSLLSVDRSRKDYMHQFNRIRQKSIDFVLVEKSSMKTKLAIELDDRSHTYAHRVTRDEMVNEACRNAGLELLRVPNQRNYNDTEVDNLIRTAFNAVASTIN